MTKKITIKQTSDQDGGNLSSDSNPISNSLHDYVTYPLTRLLQKEAYDECANAYPSFYYEEKDGEVCSMTLSFKVSSRGRELIKDFTFLRIFENVVRRVFNSDLIKLQYQPDKEDILATYQAKDFFFMVELLKAIESTGCSVRSTFVVEPEEVLNDTEMKRVGIFVTGDASRWDVYVRTGDKCKVPHVHVRNLFDVEEEFAFTLQGNNYYPHDNHIEQMSRYNLKYFADFMAQPCHNSEFANNYEYAVYLWNSKNNVE